MLANKVQEFIAKVKSLRVLVIGETIIDQFVSVRYEGQSMKSVCPVYKLDNTTINQEGGAKAIANHLRGFVEQLDIITNENKEIVKTRFVDSDDNKKHVEINKFETATFRKIKASTHDYDVVIVADFGHGFCDALEINDGFHLMCQTNSNNFGFNRVSKWKKYQKRSVCLDLREASLQMNKKIKFNNSHEIIELYNYEMNTDHLYLTLGREGSAFTNGLNIVRQETFPSEIVDTIGAGDTFFAFSALASAIEFPEQDEIMLIPALAASLSTTWLCNEKSVEPETLLHYANNNTQQVICS